MMEFDESNFDDMLEQPEEDEVDKLCREALLHLDNGDVEEARQKAMEGVDFDAEHPFPQFVLGLIADHEQDMPAARYLADTALQLAPTNSDTIQFRASLHVQDHQFEQAEHLLRYGVVHNPEDSSLHEQISRLCLAQGDLEGALASANTALRLDPVSPSALAVRAAALDTSGDHEALLAVTRQSVQMNPDDPFAMVELATLEVEHGELDRARALLQRAHRLAPRDHHIAEVRRVVEGAHSHAFLKPLPMLQRWLVAFPGGFAGLVFAFVLTALPMHEFVVQYPAYALPAWLLMGSFAAVIAYMWIVPAMLAVRLNRGAAQAAVDRLSRDEADLDVLIDAVALLFAGKRFRRGVRLLKEAATSVSSPEARAVFEHLHHSLSRWRYQIFYRLAWMPADTRILPTVGVAILLASPVLADRTSWALETWQLIPFGFLAVAWLISMVEGHLQKQFAYSFGTMHSVATETQVTSSRATARRAS